MTWRSKKQSVVSRSSAEAEFRALTLGICEGIWIQRLLGELGVTNEKPVKMLCDNQAAISIAKILCTMIEQSTSRLIDISFQRRLRRQLFNLSTLLRATKQQIYSLKLFQELTSKN